MNIARRTTRYSAPATLAALTFLVVTLPPKSSHADDPVANAGGGGGTPTLGGPLPAGTEPAALASADPSTGAANVSYQFDLPTARGDAQPSLALRYNSSAATGFAGFGWTIAIPSIVRRGGAGLPYFNDGVLATAGSDSVPFLNYDDYYINDQLLVPICVISGTGCVTSGKSNVSIKPLQAGEVLPAAFAPFGDAPGTSSSGWVYFRTEVDDGVRYFFSPDGQTWIAQSKDGTQLILGKPLDNLFPAGEAREYPDSATGKYFHFGTAAQTPVYRWNLTRRSDLYENVVYYLWGALSSNVIEGPKYLTDIYDTDNDLSFFAHHVRLTYAVTEPTGGTVYTVQGPAYSTSPIWKTPPFAHLTTVDVTSASAGNTAQRQLVRRYSLGYTTNSTSTRTFLTSIKLTGTCGSAGPAIAEDSTGALPSSLSCGTAGAPPSLPPTTYSYFGITGASSTGPSTLAKSARRTWTSTTCQGTACGTRGLLDIDGNGAADILTTIATYQNGKNVADTAYIAFGPTGSPIYTTTFSNPTSSTNEYTNGIIGPWTGGPHPALLWQSSNTATAAAPSIDMAICDTRNGVFVPGGYPCPAGTVSLQAQSAGSTHFLNDLDTNINVTGISNYNQSRTFDADGDGMTDAVLVPYIDPVLGPSYLSQLSLQHSWGGMDPMSNSALGETTIGAFNADLTFIGVQNGGLASPFYAVADVDGDGILDVVVGGKGPSVSGGSTKNHLRFYVLVGRGDGRFGSAQGVNNVGPSTNGYGIGIVPGAGASGDQSDAIGPDAQIANPAQGGSIVRFGDLNGDGMADYAVLDSKGLWMCLRKNAGWDNAHWSCTVDNGVVQSTGGGDDIEIGDIDGSGISRVVYFNTTGGGQTYLLSPNGEAESNGTGTVNLATKDGLLNTVSNGRGLVTTLSYQAVAHLPNLTLPVPTWVVTSVSATDSLASLATVLTRNYTYTGPVYDPRDRQFVGFQTVTETVPGSTLGLSPQRVTTTTFATTACSGDGCVGQDYSYYRALRGLAVSVVVQGLNSTAQPVSLRTIWNEYKWNPVYTKTNDRSVVQRTLYQEHRYVWDTAASQTATPTAEPFLSGFPGGGPSVSVAIPSAPEVRTRHNFDNFGNEVSTVNFGAVGTDTPILTQRTYPQPGGLFAWTFRPTSISNSATDTTGVTQVGTPRTLQYSYDRGAHVTLVLGGLTNSGTLSRATATLGGVADTPTQPASPQNTGTAITLASFQYDGLGQLVQRGTGNNRCESFGYDGSFDLLPTSHSVYPQGCGTTPLTTSLGYDFGFAKKTTAMLPSGSTTFWKYDGFGRLTELDVPLVPTATSTSSGVGSTTVAMCVTYSDSSPVSNVDALTADGDTAISTCSGASGLVDHKLFFDGFGDQIAREDQAGDAVNGTSTIVSGVHFRDGLGLIIAEYEPFYSSTYVPGTTTTFTTPAKLSLHDALGRTYAAGDYNVLPLNGNFTLSTFHSLSVDTVDPEQATGGGHASSKTTVTVNGLGQTTQVTAVLNNASPSGAATVTTNFYYQGTGELTKITRGSYTRWMQYDSLGRMVFNAEPNSSTNFSATIGASGVKGWSYAYNDNGQVIGTSDARGCGENIYYDGLGRMLGEDYSPCGDASQPTYSAPTISSGLPTSSTNMETYYVYDNSGGSGDFAAGLLTDVYDRAQHERRTYDARRRLQSEARQIAAPDGSGYTSTAYTKTFTYDLAGHVEAATTGADSTSLKGSTITASYASQGTLRTIGGTFGTILLNQTVDATGGATHQVFGDAGKTTADMVYDANERMTQYTLYRTQAKGSTGTGIDGPFIANGANYSVPLIVTDRTPYAGILTNLSIGYDRVGNPTSIGESITTSVGSINPLDWTAGAQPASRTMSYWDDYRLREAKSSYAGSLNGDDTYVAPYTAAEYSTQEFPKSASTPAHRVRTQDYAYDGLGDMTSSTEGDADSTSGYYERSLGTVTYSNNQLTAASSGTNRVSAGYDNAGNLTSVGVSNQSSSYAYEWDELGRLAGATRSEFGVPVANESYAYDANGMRVRETRYNFAKQANEHTIQVFDSLVLQRAAYQSGDYVHTDSTENVYVAIGGISLAHVLSSSGLPSASSSNVHTFLTIGDRMGSVSFVIEKDTGELVERTTYQAYGAVESDYRNPRWSVDTGGTTVGSTSSPETFREPIRYAGHWDDAEVGLIYFGFRYYAPQLGVWASPDPLTVHGVASDLNPYAFVRGSPYRFRDALGLTPQEGGEGPPSDETCVLFVCWGGTLPQGGSGGFNVFGWYPFGGGPSDPNVPQQDLQRPTPTYQAPTRPPPPPAPGAPRQGGGRMTPVPSAPAAPPGVVSPIPPYLNQSGVTESFALTAVAGVTGLTVAGMAAGGEVVAACGAGVEGVEGATAAGAVEIAEGTAEAATSLTEAVGDQETANLVKQVLRGRQEIDALSPAVRQAAGQFYRQVAERVVGNQAAAARLFNLARADFLEGLTETPPGTLPEFIARMGL